MITALYALFSALTALEASSRQGGEFDNHSETEIALNNNKFEIYCYFRKLAINLKNQGVRYMPVNNALITRYKHLLLTRLKIRSSTQRPTPFTATYSVLQHPPPSCTES